MFRIKSSMPDHHEVALATISSALRVLPVLSLDVVFGQALPHACGDRAAAPSNTPSDEAVEMLDPAGSFFDRYRDHGLGAPGGRLPINLFEPPGGNLEASAWSARILPGSATAASASFMGVFFFLLRLTNARSHDFAASARQNSASEAHLSGARTIRWVIGNIGSEDHDNALTAEVAKSHRV